VRRHRCFPSTKSVHFIYFQSIFQVFQTFQMDVASVSYMDVAKVDQNVAHVAMAIHVCCKSLFKMFHLLF
jgi:hypothetical protein